MDRKVCMILVLMSWFIVVIFLMGVVSMSNKLEIIVLVKMLDFWLIFYMDWCCFLVKVFLMIVRIIYFILVGIG